MKKNVIISISGTQTSLDGDSEHIELMTPGTLARKGGAYLLSYQETPLSGLDGTETTFHIHPEFITLLRRGSINTEMTFEKGRKHLSAYETAAGVVTVGVNTHSIAASIDDSGGSIDIRYVVDVENLSTGENHFHILVQEPRSASAPVSGPTI
ncbi:MAG: DUF1934 domain-containing protein [Oscillospiraceae bacterium]|nr:DUF1934 domain-containing protein [Oscillospiraceae bacterium]